MIGSLSRSPITFSPGLKPNTLFAHALFVGTVFLLATVSLLSACTGNPFGSSRSGTASRAFEVEDSADSEDGVQHEQREYGRSPPQTNEDIASLPDKLVQKQDLIGLRQREMINILGSPVLLRVDGATRVLQFRLRDCIIDAFFLAPSPASVHVEFRGKRPGDIITQGCILIR